MRGALGWRFGWLAAVMLASAGMAQAYTRAYLVNNTGETVYSLHVTLTQPAQPGSAGSGQLSAIFTNATVSADGMTLDFTMPLDPAGIIQNQLVWIGWTDLNPQLTGQIASFWWGDAAGNQIGSVQYPPYGDTGAITPPSNDGSPAGGTGTPGAGGNNLTGSPGDNTNGVNNQNGGNPTDPGNFTPTDPNNSGNPTDPNNNGGDPPNNGGITNPGPSQTQATPEPATSALIGGAIALLFASLSRRRRG